LKLYWAVTIQHEIRLTTYSITYPITSSPTACCAHERLIHDAVMK